MALIPCSTCDRHVRPGDSSCPFCGAAMLRAAPLRSGLAAMTLAIPLAMASCRAQTKYGGPPPPEPAPVEQTTAADPNQDSTAPEPEPEPETTSSAEEAGPEDDGRLDKPMYGAPPPRPDEEPEPSPGG